MFSTEQFNLQEMSNAIYISTILSYWIFHNKWYGYLHESHLFLLAESDRQQKKIEAKMKMVWNTDKMEYYGYWVNTRQYYYG